MRHFDAALRERVSRVEADEAGADDDAFLRFFRCLADFARVVQVAQAVNVFALAEAGHGRDEVSRASGDEQLVVEYLFARGA